MTSSFNGFGVSLKPNYYHEILTTNPPIDWFEIITEDYLVAGGAPLHLLDEIAQRYPVALHGVSLSIGGTDPLNYEYLQKLKALKQRVQPLWISDHLCWTGVNQINLHDLMPLPYTQSVLQHVVDRIKQIQDFLETRILIENISSYVCYKDSTMTESEFIANVAEQADCFILLDINNVYVNAYNNGLNPQSYFNALPVSRVKQLHLAGHDNKGTHIVDTHDALIISDVWQLFASALKRFGPVATLIERDGCIPQLSELVAELTRAREISQAVCVAKQEA